MCADVVSTNEPHQNIPRTQSGVNTTRLTTLVCRCQHECPLVSALVSSMTGVTLLLLMVSVQCTVAARQRKAAPPLTVSWTDKTGNSSTCGGVALTRHHVLASRACISVQSKSIKVELQQGKVYSRSATLIQIPELDKTAVTLLSLGEPILSGGGVTVGDFKTGEVKVRQGKVDIPCQLQDALQLVCDIPLVAPGSGWPVFGANGKLLGFVANNLMLDPIKEQMSIIGDAIAADFAKRFSNGEKRIFKCKRTETQALEYLLVT